MRYTSRYAGDELTPEEMDVKAALWEYTTASATEFDWTPGWKLYRLYCIWWAEHRWRYEPDRPARLTRRQFGRAVHRVFPTTRRCRRKYLGKRYQRGFAYLLGPESIASRPPRFKRTISVPPIAA